MRSAFLVPLLSLFSSANSYAGANAAQLSCDNDKFWVSGDVPADYSTVEFEVENGDEFVRFATAEVAKEIAQELASHELTKDLVVSEARGCEMKDAAYDCEVHGVTDKGELVTIKGEPKSFQRSKAQGTTRVLFDAEIVVRSKALKTGEIRLPSARCLWKVDDL